MRLVLLDLDEPDDVFRVWWQMALYRDLRRVDPRLRSAIFRRTDEAEATGRLTDHGAADVRGALDRMHPEAVLASHWRELIEDRPTLGAFSLAVAA